MMILPNVGNRILFLKITQNVPPCSLPTFEATLTSQGKKKKRNMLFLYPLYSQFPKDGHKKVEKF